MSTKAVTAVLKDKADVVLLQEVGDDKVALAALRGAYHVAHRPRGKKVTVSVLYWWSFYGHSAS
jgi:hypothetical protein